MVAVLHIQLRRQASRLLLERIVPFLVGIMRVGARMCMYYGSTELDTLITGLCIGSRKHSRHRIASYFVAHKELHKIHVWIEESSDGTVGDIDMIVVVLSADRIRCACYERSR